MILLKEVVIQTEKEEIYKTEVMTEIEKIAEKLQS